MRKLKTLAALAALLFAGTSVFAQGVNLQGLQVKPFEARSASDVITAVSTDVGIYVKYVGTAAGAATVAVAAGGDVSFVANGAADTTINSAGTVCGATPGTLDLSTPPAGCDTFGEVVALINQSPNWVAALGSVLATDSTNDTLITLVAADAKNPEGLGLLKDTTKTLNVTLQLFPGSNGGRVAGIQNFLPASGSGTGSSLGDTGGFGFSVGQQNRSGNPFRGRHARLLYASENVTSTGAVGNFIVYCRVPSYVRRPVSSTANASTYSEVLTTLYLEAGAATTVTGKIDEFVNAGGLGCDNGDLLVRISATTDLTAPTVLATGYVTSVDSSK